MRKASKLMRFRISGDSTGLYVVVEFKQIAFSDEVIEHINQQNVRIYPIEDHAIRKCLHQNKILLGYGNLPIEKIPAGIERMKNALDSRHLQAPVWRVKTLIIVKEVLHLRTSAKPNRWYNRNAGLSGETLSEITA